MKAVNKYLIAGLVVFYLPQWFAPNKHIYFASYGLLALFFFLAQRDIIRALSYTLILSLFSETTLASSLFKLDPDIGAGYFFSPLTMVTFALLAVSFKRGIKTSVKQADILAVLFLLWNVVLLFLRPHPNSLFGVLSLGEMTVAFLLLRSTLTREDLGTIPLLLSSMLVFQVTVGLLQFITGGTVGILAESVTIEYPYGLTAVEEEELFRVSGTSGHANMFAVSLLALVPYLFHFRSTVSHCAKAAWSIVLFATFSRLAWVVAGFEFLYLGISQFDIRRLTTRIGVSFVSLAFIVFIIFAPLFFLRIETIPEAFDEYGSVGIRLKSYQEAWNQIAQHPFSGVGPNMFLTFAAEDPVTDIWRLGKLTPANKIHNLFLEIFTEAGFVGMFIFISFIITAWRSANDKHKVAILTKVGFISYLIYALFHPMFLIPQMRILYLLSAIMLIR